jgi:1,4-dihydroxy-2-naphthoyl-CoA synthase
VTNEAARVVVVEVLVEVDVDDVVVAVLVDGDAVGGGVVDEVVAADVTITVGPSVLGPTDADVLDPDEHDKITCDETTSAHHHVRLVIGARLINSE